MGKLINRIPGSRLLISSLPGSALRTHVESLGKPRDVIMCSQGSSRCQHAFSKPCLLNLISKETHLVFSIYLSRLLCCGLIAPQEGGIGIRLGDSTQSTGTSGS